jgi:hypothetical protein
MMVVPPFIGLLIRTDPSSRPSNVVGFPAAVPPVPKNSSVPSPGVILTVLAIF